MEPDYTALKIVALVWGSGLVLFLTLTLINAILTLWGSDD